MENKIILVMMAVILISFVSAVPQTFNIHGKLSNSSGALTGTYEMNFSLYDVYRKIYKERDCDNSNMIPGDLTRLPDESFFLKIDLPFSAQYYLGVDV